MRKEEIQNKTKSRKINRLPDTDDSKNRTMTLERWKAKERSPMTVQLTDQRLARPPM